MAYLHCHNCGWSQDDFWNFKFQFKNILKWQRRPFGYNPISLILEDFAVYVKPKYIKMDTNWMKENNYSGNKIHSWKLMMHDIKRHLKNSFMQTWWTYNSWKKDRKNNIARCPKCHKKEYFDID